LDLDISIVESSSSTDSNCKNLHSHGEEDGGHKHTVAELEAELNEMHALVQEHEKTIKELKEAQEKMRNEVDSKNHEV
jgi:hypothetical protein